MCSCKTPSSSHHTLSRPAHHSPRPHTRSTARARPRHRHSASHTLLSLIPRLAPSHNWSAFTRLSSETMQRLQRHRTLLRTAPKSRQSSPSLFPAVARARTRLKTYWRPSITAMLLASRLICRQSDGLRISRQWARRRMRISSSRMSHWQLRAASHEVSCVVVRTLQPC